MRKYNGKYSLTENFAGRGLGLLKESREGGAEAERIAHECYGVPFKGGAGAGQTDIKLPDGRTGEVKKVESNGTFKMELTKSGESLYGGEGIRSAAEATKTTWPGSTIPNETVREVMKSWCSKKGTTPNAFAEKVKNWYLGKADVLVAVVGDECFEIPLDQVTIVNNTADAGAYQSYGAGPRIVIVGKIPSNYSKFKVGGK